ncbi:MAG: ester cyclase [Actinomycetota bacterium]|nr:ester cyclase [Actinomycetota bacterium]
MSNVDKYRSAHEAFNRRDWTVLSQNFAANAEYTDQARGVTVKSPQELVDYLKVKWVAAFSDAAITEACYIDAGDHAIAQFTAAGTNDGAFGPMPRTGRRISTPFCEIVRFNAAGQIISGSLYYDQMTILVQLGHMEVPPAT